MTTEDPRRNAKISIMGMTALAVVGVAGVAFLLDRWIVGGAVARKVAEACQLAVRTCSTALSPMVAYIPGIRIAAASLGVAAFVYALIKAAGVLFFARRLKKSEGPEGPVPARVAEAAAAAGAQDIAIRYVMSGEPIAYTDGIIRPSIHLSEGLVGELDDEQLKSVIAHEAAHVRHRDNLSIFIALILRDFLFILPLSHLLFNSYMKQKEFAADDLATKTTGDPVGLADAIVKVARLKVRSGTKCPAYATFFPDKGTVRARVTRLLGTGAPVKVGTLRLTVAAVFTFAIIGGFAGIAIAQPGTSALSPQCKKNPACVRLNGACCVKR